MHLLATTANPDEQPWGLPSPPPDNAIGSPQGRCRVHRAEILRLRWFLDDAEKEVLRACEELRPYLRRELGWPLFALVHLAHGEIAVAAASIRAALDRTIRTSTYCAYSPDSKIAAAWKL